MDVYGSGPDDQAIQRAFFGRKGILEATPKTTTVTTSSSATTAVPPLLPATTTPDRMAHQIFNASSNLRDQLVMALSAPSRAPVLPEQDEEIPIEVVWDDSVEEPVVVPTPSMEQKLVLASQTKEQQQAQHHDSAIHTNASTNEDKEDSKDESTPSIPQEGSIPEEATTDTVGPSPPSPTTNPTVPLPMPVSPIVELPLSPNNSVKETMEFPNPFVILSELSSQFVGTGFFATKAVSKIGQNTVGFGLNALSSEQSPSESNSEVGSDSETNTELDDEKLMAVTPKSPTQTNAKETPQPPDTVAVKKSRRLRLFDPIKSRFELRRHPVPARFMGMKDHAVLKEVTKHKIFLNPSKSEVLCTTSAEALAMGKFVILPKHPSNTFFLQFENCLAYEGKKDCVEKIKWALENDPKPLSEQERFQLTWEGANERLFKAAAMTERQVEDWKKNREASDVDAARLHYETIRRGRGVQKLLHRSSSILSKKSNTSNGR